MIPRAGMMRAPALSPAAMQALQQRRQGAQQPQRAAGGQITTQQIKQYVNAEPWVYYDTFVVSAGAFAGVTVANFAGVVFPIPFFAFRTVGNAGYAITNVQDTNKLEADFVAQRIMIQVFGNPDILITDATTTMTASYMAWADAIINGCTFQLDFSTNLKYVAPVHSHPGGGGMYVPSLSRSLTAAADNEIATPTNGMPDNRANQKLGEDILFKQGSTFRAQLNGMGPPALPAAQSVQTQINALTALAGTNRVGVRMVLEGVRGTPLMVATPNGPRPASEVFGY